jgi:hypothetical protein
MWTLRARTYIGAKDSPSLHNSSLEYIVVNVKVKAVLLTPPRIPSLPSAHIWFLKKLPGSFVARSNAQATAAAGTGMPLIVLGFIGIIRNSF